MPLPEWRARLRHDGGEADDDGGGYMLVMAGTEAEEVTDFIIAATEALRRSEALGPRGVKQRLVVMLGFKRFRSAGITVAG
ncbi:MAG: hypothetical protein JWR00_2276 [Rubritepida sp.]|nr:hypothetical protein [Rubritepida sp.]